MSREILFHGKRTDNGEWVEGSLITFDNRYFIVPEFGVISIEEEKIGNVDRLLMVRGWEVDPATVGQYTSLKDCNGKMIFEGHICEMVYNGVLYTFVIVWDESELDFKGTNGKKEYGKNFEYLTCCEQIEIIGNIYDNPELLEGIEQ